MSISHAETSHATWEPRYQLGDAEMHRLYQEVVDQYGMGHQGVDFYALPGYDERSNLARQVAREVFDDSFSNDNAVMHREYGPYENSSLYFTAMHDARPIGVMGIIENSGAGLKSINDVLDTRPLDAHPDAPRVKFEDVVQSCDITDISKCWDIAISGILRPYRGAAFNYLRTGFYRATYATSLAKGVEHWVTIMNRPQRIDVLTLGFPFKPVLELEPFNYLEAPSSMLMYCKVADIEASLRASAQKAEAEGNQVRAKLIGRILQGDEVDELMRFDF